MALGELGLVVGLSGAVVWMSQQGTIVPWIVQVDRAGHADAIGPADAQARASDPEVAYALSQFVERVRSVPADPIVLRQDWLRAYDFTTDKGAVALNDYRTEPIITARAVPRGTGLDAPWHRRRERQLEQHR